MSAKFYIHLDTYWQNSADRFFGPYASREDAEAALDATNIVRADNGHSAPDVRYNVRCNGIVTTTEARKRGMKQAINDDLPNNATELHDIEARNDYGN